MPAASATPTPRIKAPKKQAAGRAGAAARKAKQDKLLAQLREAKERARAATPPPLGAATVEPVEPTKPQVAERRHDTTSASSDWTPLIVGAVAVAGVAAFALRSSRQTSHGIVDARQMAPKAPMPAAQQLKVRDPFVME